ncbi:MAG: hypothetical protein AB8F34_01270 [Akkermansiaceae bacterium]
MLKQIIILAGVLLSFASAKAQDDALAGRTCRLVFPEKPSNSPKFAYLYDGKENHKVYLSGVNFSDVVKLRPGDISLVIAPEPIIDPENIPPGYPRLAIKKEVRDLYIFLSPDTTNDVMPLRARMLRLDSTKFKSGNTLWYNFTNHRIAAKLGESRMKVDAKKFVISEDPLPKSGYYKAEFIFQPNSTGKFRRITEQQWWFDANSRHVGFIADRGSRLPRIYFFRDFRSKLKKKPIED